MASKSRTTKLSLQQYLMWNENKLAKNRFFANLFWSRNYS